jgi:hypothetical protein
LDFRFWIPQSKIQNPKSKSNGDQCLLESASSNSFVVLSVTLAGGAMSSGGLAAPSDPVLGAGVAIAWLDPGIARGASRAAMISATPLPKAAKPGISSQMAQ